MRLTPAIGFPLLAALLVALELLGAGGALEYRRAVAFAEPWRLLTGHFVHLSFLHALLNAVALLLLGRLFADRLRVWEAWTIVLGAPIAISLAFRLAMPELEWYRGLSGVLHALYFTGCIVWVAATAGRARWLPIAALVAGTVKVLVEQPWDASFPVHEVLRIAVVPQAHLAGAVVGAAAGLLMRGRRPAASG